MRSRVGTQRRNACSAALAGAADMYACVCAEDGLHVCTAFPRWSISQGKSRHIRAISLLLATDPDREALTARVMESGLRVGGSQMLHKKSKEIWDA